jgi:hypothetical protein
MNASSITPNENAPNVVINIEGADTVYTTHNIISAPTSTEPEVGNDSEGRQMEQFSPAKGQQPGMVLDHQQNILVSPRPPFFAASNEIEVVNQHLCSDIPPSQSVDNFNGFSDVHAHDQPSQSPKDSPSIDMTETVQNHSVGEENEQPTPLLEPTTNHLSTNTTENQQPIDVFISSISRPISQPLLDVGTVTPMQQHNPTNLHASLTQVQAKGKALD